MLEEQVGQAQDVGGGVDTGVADSTAGGGDTIARTAKVAHVPDGDDGDAGAFCNLTGVAQGGARCCRCGVLSVPLSEPNGVVTVAGVAGDLGEVSGNVAALGAGRSASRNISFNRRECWKAARTAHLLARCRLFHELENPEKHHSSR